MNAAVNAAVGRLNDRVLEQYVARTTGLTALPDRKMSWVRVFFAILVMVAAAVAFVMCLNRGYRGFSGNWRFHKVWRVPVGIDLGCY